MKRPGRILVALVIVVLSLRGSVPVDAAGSLLAAAGNPGHPYISATQPFTAHGRWTVHWAFDCRERPTGAGDLLVIIAHGNATEFPRQYWIDIYRSPVAPAGSGVLPFGHAGYYRLWLRVPSRCGWTVRVIE